MIQNIIIMMLKLIQLPRAHNAEREDDCEPHALRPLDRIQRKHDLIASKETYQCVTEHML
jgi:hypothetical protein